MLSTVFAPELFLLAVTVLLVGWEFRSGRWGGRGDGFPSEDSGSGTGHGIRKWGRVAPRVAVVGVAWGLAFAVYQGGPALLSTPAPGGEDFFASLGLIVGFALIGAVWRRRAWGSLLPAYCLLLVVTSAVHILVVPVWDVSSHVVYAAVPTGFLATVHRRFAALFVVPLALAWSRVALDAHTLDQSLGALALAAVIVGAAVYRRRSKTVASLG